MKNTSRFLIPTYCLLFLLPTSSAWAITFEAQDDLLWIDGTATSIFISSSDLLGNDTTDPFTSLMITRQPTFGSLTNVPGGFSYLPTDDFRSLAHDSFRYTVQSKSGNRATATAHLFMQIPSELVHTQGFESTDPVNYDRTSIPDNPNGFPLDPIQITAAAAFEGAQGLRIDVPQGSDEPAYISFPLFADNNDDGRTTLLGCGDGGIVGGAAVITVSNIGDDVNNSPLRVVVTENSVGIPSLRADVRLPDESGYAESPLLPFTTEVTDIDLQWSPDGIVLGANGTSISFRSPVTFEPGPLHVQLGVMPFGNLVEDASLEIDRIRIYRKSEDPEPFPEIFSDRFQDALGHWSAAYGSGLDPRLHEIRQGEEGLRVELAMGDSFLVDTSPAAEGLFKARFTLDVTDVRLPSGETRIFDLGNHLDPIFGSENTSLRLRTINEEVNIAAFAEGAFGTVNTPWVPLTGSHSITLKVRSSITPLLPSGLVRLWIDGLPFGEILELGNFSALVEWVRLGAPGADPQADGVLVFQDYESWR